MKNKSIFTQLFRFIVVGAVATVFDFIILVILKELLKMDLLLSSAISFLLSTVLNYVLSMSFVFKGKTGNKTKEFVLFLLLSLSGLLVNQFIMWLGTQFFVWHYIAVKLFAVCFVTVYNFVTRKILLENTKF